MRYFKHLLFGVVLVFIDLVSKFYFMYNSLDFGFFSLNYSANTGIAFGFFKGFNLLFVVLSFIIIGTIFYYYNNIKNSQYAFDLILAGAFGNLINRIFYGHVIDFIDFKFWPIFNFADVFVVIGVILFIWGMHNENDRN